jgi:hypothetical protein
VGGFFGFNFQTANFLKAVIASQRVARMRARRRAQLRSRSDDRLREAIRGNRNKLDGFVAPLLAKTLRRNSAISPRMAREFY